VRTLDVTPGAKLSSEVRWLNTAEGRLLIQLADHTLALAGTGPDDPPAWQTALGNFAVTGSPGVAGDTLWLADAQGQVAAHNFHTGAVQLRKQCPQSLRLGLRELGGTWWAVAADGTLYRVDSLPEVQP
jgi:hypothetical protein